MCKDFHLFNRFFPKEGRIFILSCFLPVEGAFRRGPSQVEIAHIVLTIVVLPLFRIPGGQTVWMHAVTR